MANKSPTKILLKAFLVDTKLDEEMSFDWREDDVQQCIHRMRVELARVRARVKTRGQIPQPFSLQFVGVKPLQGRSGVVTVTIRKAQTIGQKQSEEVTQMMEAATLKVASA